MKDIRCASCRALLFRTSQKQLNIVIEIKCRRCRSLNILRPTEPPPERNKAPRKVRHGVALYTKTMRGISLCAGYGGLELGITIAEPNYRTICFVEREAHAAATLVARMEDEAMDNAPVWDDVKTFNGKEWHNKVHLLTAGYPCQPFSFSGK